MQQVGQAVNAQFKSPGRFSVSLLPDCENRTGHVRARAHNLLLRSIYHQLFLCILLDR